MVVATSALRCALIPSLSRTERLILLMTFADRLAPHEVAAVLGMPEPHVNRCVAELRARATAALCPPPATA